MSAESYLVYNVVSQIDYDNVMCQSQIERHKLLYMYIIYCLNKDL
jgi:hypothetical protein